MPLVKFHVCLCEFICCEVDVKPVFLNLEEESLLGSKSRAACVDQNLHSSFIYVDQIEMLEAGTKEEGKPLLIKTRKRGDEELLDVSSFNL